LSYASRLEVIEALDKRVEPPKPVKPVSRKRKAVSVNRPKPKPPKRKRKTKKTREQDNREKVRVFWRKKQLLEAKKAKALGTIFENGDECSICTDEMSQSGPAVKLTPCLHAFHEECLSHWLVRQTTCPFCRTIINNVI
jgi:hypothetical protein